MSAERKKMPLRTKRIFGISILLLAVGLFKIYTKGVYDEDGEIKWMTVFVPFGMGILAMIYTLVLVILDKRE